MGSSNPALLWDTGTAYDFLISLHVLHTPDRFGLRGSWAAGVRSRLPAAERKVLEQAEEIFWLPLHWLYRLPEPKDGQTLLAELEKIPARERLPVLGLRPSLSQDLRELLQDVQEHGSWKKADLEQMRSLLKNRIRTLRQDTAEIILNGWADPAGTGEAYLAALKVYYEVFFAEEEHRIRPAIDKSLEHAQKLSRKVDIDSLLAELSLGVHFEPPLFHPEADLVLAPSFWITPLVVYEQLSENRWIFVFGGRPEDASLVPGEPVPDSLLQSLKALADPTRLRILRYLLDRPLTPSQLARMLRLRAPTVVHHLNELRLAGLVHLTLVTPEKKGERRYAARVEAIPRLFSTLQSFLEQTDTETEEERFSK